jgi:hypothetical protein
MDTCSQTDLVALAGRLVPLRQVSHDEYAGPCPRCGGVDRFHVKRDWFFCRQCYPYSDPGVGHDAIGFIRWLEGLGYEAARACLEVGTTPPQPGRPTSARGWRAPAWQERAARFLQAAQARLDDAEGACARAYLEQRGLRPETWRAWGLGYAVIRHPRLKQDAPAILLPWRAGRLIQAITYRFFGPGIGPDDRYAQMPGGQPLLFGLEALSDHLAELWLVEGEFNALALWQTARDLGLGLDVLSFGSERGATNALTLAIARRYPRVVVWCDTPERARAAYLHLVRGGLPPAAVTALRSPLHEGEKLDANALLGQGLLAEIVTGLHQRRFQEAPAPQPARCTRSQGNDPWAYPWPPPQDPGRCPDCGRPLPPDLPGWKCAACSIRTFAARGWPVPAALRQRARREAEEEVHDR